MFFLDHLTILFLDPVPACVNGMFKDDLNLISLRPARCLIMDRDLTLRLLCNRPFQRENFKSFYVFICDVFSKINTSCPELATDCFFCCFFFQLRGSTNIAFCYITDWSLNCKMSVTAQCANDKDNYVVQIILSTFTNRTALKAEKKTVIRLTQTLSVAWIKMK